MKDVKTKINSKDEFIVFMTGLIEDFKNNQGSWENKTLLDYLSAIQSWTEGMEGFYVNNDLDLPTGINWTVFADILTAATIYE